MLDSQSGQEIVEILAETLSLYPCTKDSLQCELINDEPCKDNVFDVPEVML